MNKIDFNGKEVTPSKIICIGRNYVEHISELGNEIPDDMVVFNKPNSAIGRELYAFYGEPIHYEAEICFLYQSGKFSAVGVGLDLTKRALQSSLKGKGLPWERAKAFNNSALFSKFVSLDSPDDLTIELIVNDELRQRGNVGMMMYKPSDILKGIESFMTLEDGDIVMTGTPKGVGQVCVGDKFTGRILGAAEKLVEVCWIAK